MDARRKEAVRYLGFGGHAVDEKTQLMIEECFAELSKIADAKMVYRIFPFTQKEEKIQIGKIQICSKNLAKNLKGCKKLILLGATLGIGVDQRMKRYSYTDMAKAVTLQACAAAELEEYLNQWQEKKKKELRKEGLYLRPRFSPGYGDFSILHQKDILNSLDTGKKIGLSMTDSSMLTPTKSVTAVLGISEEEKSCPQNGCEVCEKSDCEYRRN